MSKGFWWLMFLFGSVFGARMWDFDIRGDGMNYAAISNNVLYSSDPLILTINDQLYMNKPPLFFWANALFIKLFGANPLSVRVATLIAVMLIVLFLYKIGLELFEDNNTALMIPFLFFLTYIVYKNTHMVKMEAFVSAFVAGSMYFFLRYLREERLLYMLFAGGAVGLAIFSKGPLGLITFVAALVFPLFSSDFRSKRYYLHLCAGFLTAVSISAWWFVYISVKTPFFDTFFIEQIIDRVGNNSLGLSRADYMERPVWRYLYYIGKYGGLFLLLFPVGIYRLIRDDMLSTGVKFMLTLGAVYFIIIHFITTREHRYLYQFYLIFSFVSAYGLTSMVKKDLTPVIKYLGLIFVMIMAVYPGSLDWDSYGALQKLRSVSQTSGLPVVVRDEVVKDISDKAAVSFYVRDHRKSPPEKGEWLEVVPRKASPEGGTELFRSKRVKVYLFQPAEPK